jgi:Tol biopolymer transport system component
VARRLLALLGAAFLVAASGTVLDGPQPFDPIPVNADGSIMDATSTAGDPTLYLTRVEGHQYAIVSTSQSGGAWSAPVTAPFSGRWRDLEEVLAPDGRSMVFASSRPIDGGNQAISGFFSGKVQPERGGNLWIVRREGSGWGTPTRLADAVNVNTSTFSPALAGDGTLYYMHTVEPDHHFHLFVAKPANGAYAASAPAPFDDPTFSSWDPTVPADGSFVIFGSNRPPAPKGKSALFIAYRVRDAWTVPAAMGSAINPNNDASEPRLSPDETSITYSSASSSGLWRADVTPWVRPFAVLPAPVAVEPSVVRDNDSSPSFLSGGDALLYARNGAIVESTKRNDSWSQPVTVPFSGRRNDMDPVFSPDGSYAIFSSTRPPAAPKGTANLWKVTRTKNGWSAPRMLPASVNDGAFLVAPSIANDGTLYYLRIGSDHSHRLYRSRLDGDTYLQSEPLSFSGQDARDYDPGIAPDQSFVIFSSANRLSGDSKRHLFVAFARSGAWGPVVPLRYQGDTGSDDGGALIGRDGETLYFTSDRDNSSYAWTISLRSWWRRV